MRLLAILLTGGAVLAASAACGADDPEPPNKGGEIRGTWVFSRVVGNGPGAPPGDVELTFEKGKATVKVGDQLTKSHKFTIDPRKKPAHIDITDSDRGKKIEGIYKIDKGELYLCIGERTGKRPTAFDGKQEPVIVMKRQKK